MDRRTTITVAVVAVTVVAIAIVLSVRGDDPPAASPSTSTSDTAQTKPSTTASDTTTTTPLTLTTATAPPSTLAPGATACDRYENVAVAGTVASSGLVEASGMAASRTNPGVLWAHNDSRDGARVYAIGPTGEDLGGFDIAGALAFDWEDMAASAVAEGSDATLYFGDIGDNFEIRAGRVTVYRVPEPDLATLSGVIEGAVPLEYAYPDGVFNAEALFVADGSIYIVTKDREEARVYRGDAADGSTTETLELVTTLSLEGEVSGADVSWDGTTIALRGYRTVWLWHRPPGTSIADALATPPCTAPSPNEVQGEAIAFLPDDAYVTISEGANPDLNVVPVIE